MNKRPGGRLASRPLHFIWILDCSGSMKTDGKIQALNTAIREALPHIRAAANQNPEAEVLLRAITFSSGAQWHVAQPTPVEEFRWVDYAVIAAVVFVAAWLVFRHFSKRRVRADDPAR